MERHSRHILGSGLALAIYVVCTVVVLSFIVFEVLDVDGSDFPGRHTMAATPATLSEAAHDVRRAFLKGPASVRIIDVAVLFAGRSAEPLRTQPRAACQVSLPVPSHAHGTRVTLPRASLPAAPPSA